MKKPPGKFIHTLIADTKVFKEIEDARKNFLPYSNISRNAFINHLILLGLKKLKENKK